MDTEGKRSPLIVMLVASLWELLPSTFEVVSAVGWTRLEWCLSPWGRGQFIQIDSWLQDDEQVGWFRRLSRSREGRSQKENIAEGSVNNMPRTWLDSHKGSMSKATLCLLRDTQIATRLFVRQRRYIEYASEFFFYSFRANITFGWKKKVQPVFTGNCEKGQIVDISVVRTYIHGIQNKYNWIFCSIWMWIFRETTERYTFSWVRAKVLIFYLKVFCLMTVCSETLGGRFAGKLRLSLASCLLDDPEASCSTETPHDQHNQRTFPFPHANVFVDLHLLRQMVRRQQSHNVW